MQRNSTLTGNQMRITPRLKGSAFTRLSTSQSLTRVTQVEHWKKSRALAE